MVNFSTTTISTFLQKDIKYKKPSSYYTSQVKLPIKFICFRFHYPEDLRSLFPIFRIGLVLTQHENFPTIHKIYFTLSRICISWAPMKREQFVDVASGEPTFTTYNTVFYSQAYDTVISCFYALIKSPICLNKLTVGRAGRSKNGRKETRMKTWIPRALASCEGRRKGEGEGEGVGDDFHTERCGGCQGS